MFGKYIFVGNAKGIIRVLDITRQAEVRPLASDETKGLKVHTVSVSESGAYLISGHFNGFVCIWDLKTYRLARKMDVHGEGQIVYATRVFYENKDFINIVSTDESGTTFKIEVVRHSTFGKITYRHSA
jgi:WD40 repeat protein